MKERLLFFIIGMLILTMGVTLTFRGAIEVGTIVVTLTLGLVVQFFYPVFVRALGKMQAPKGPVITK
ncbi:hypothetical protein ACFRCQ_06700 [Cytobacillus firmus]|uniref:hypothetical protein n=1 Tax=Cytobacillus firmus TaxID=1399 RepID=UPI00369AFF71